MALSLTFLLVGILAYGAAGAFLSSGSRGEMGALRSHLWWIGTSLQGLGFLLTFVARHSLPLLLVQAAVVGALGVTALLGQVTGIHRLDALDALAVAAVVAGLASLTAATDPGPSVPLSLTTAAVLAAAAVITAGVIPLRLPPPVAGFASGVGFSVAAVGARLLVAQPDRSLLEAILPFGWTAADWFCVTVVLAGLGLGQLHLTRGLSTDRGVGTLTGMYVASTLVAGLIGVVLLGEQPRAGTLLLVAAGLTLTLLGAGRLVRLEGPSPSFESRETID